MNPPLPHQKVFARLGLSTIHGIGVFAQQRIPAGTNVFQNDTREIRWIDASVLADPSLRDFERQFYEDFAIRRDHELGCPANFDLLTVGWYVNEPAIGDEPNLTATGDADLIALRDIEKGEELTLLYSSFAAEAQGNQP